jgi:hypothetical protein
MFDVKHTADIKTKLKALIDFKKMNKICTQTIRNSKRKYMRTITTNILRITHVYLKSIFIQI